MTDKSLKNKAISIKGKDYVLVSDRILYFNESYPKGAIVTEELDNEQRVEFKATVIPDVTLPERKFTGHSQAVWGDGMVNKTAATENAETSAVGRALAMMGIGVIESVASADEIHKSTSQPATGKFATPKQVEWIRNTAARVANLDNAEDIDNWVEEQIGAKPQKLAIGSVKRAVDKIELSGIQERVRVVKQPDTIITDIPENITLDKLPY